MVRGCVGSIIYMHVSGFESGNTPHTGYLTLIENFDTMPRKSAGQYIFSPAHALGGGGKRLPQ